MNEDSCAEYKKRLSSVEVYTHELLAYIMASCFYTVRGYVVTAIVRTGGDAQSKDLLCL